MELERGQYSEAVRAAGERLVVAMLDLARAAAQQAAAEATQQATAEAAQQPRPESPPAVEPDRWLTAEQAASRAGRHPATARKALESGLMHGHQTKRRGRWQIKVAAVDAWIDGSDGAAACGCAKLYRSRGRSRL